MLLRNARTRPDLGPVDLHVRDGRLAPDSDGREVDLDGRFVVPGLWDHHVHFAQWAQVSRRIDLSATTSARETASVVRDALPIVADEVVIGHGFRDALWPDDPTVELLDFTERPIVLVSADLHCVWVNHAAARRFSVAPGVVVEAAAMALYGRLAPARETLDGWVREAVRAAAARGVVGVVDLEAPFALDDWLRIQPAVRVRTAVWPAALDDAIGRGHRTGDVVDGLVSMGPLKVITDGSLNTRTAYCHDAYPGTQSRGLLVVPGDELQALMSRARAAGLDSAIHAIGDAANAAVLDAFAATGATGSIEHAQLLDHDSVTRFAGLGVVASVQPEHAMDDRDVADRYWRGRTGRAFVLRSLLDAGVRLAFGSDAPVAPLDPWLAMAAAVTRARDGRDAWHPEQAVTVDEALAASVATTLHPGQTADLVVLDGNPWKVDELRTMPVRATLLDGEVISGEL